MSVFGPHVGPQATLAPSLGPPRAPRGCGLQLTKTLWTNVGNRFATRSLAPVRPPPRTAQD
eukprot:8932911-Pyramimonas_sp.AAC.1